MALLPRALRRPTAILKMPAAIASGMSPSAFLRKIKKTTGGYRMTTFFADWRGVGNIEAKKDRRKYTRRDRLPKLKEVADVPWEFSKEFMHKAAIYSRTAPGEPLTERFVNVMSDKLLTGQQIIEEVYTRWETWDRDSTPDRLERVIPTDVYRTTRFD